MEIYLIRHTTPAVAKGVCYGQADLDVTSSFYEESAIIQQYLPADISKVFSSPMKRCKILADHLFSKHAVELQDDLMEINCGEWELQLWDDIPKAAIERWMNNIIQERIPGGESYQELYERVIHFFEQIIAQRFSGTGVTTALQSVAGPLQVAIVAHGGVIRSILSHITQTPLNESFRAFALHYGCVIKVVYEAGSLRHEVLSNIYREKETHKPSNL